MDQREKNKKRRETTAEKYEASWSPARSESVIPSSSAPKPGKRQRSASADAPRPVSPNTQLYLNDRKRIKQAVQEATVFALTEPPITKSHKSGLESGHSEDLVMASDPEPHLLQMPNPPPEKGSTTPVLDEGTANNAELNCYLNLIPPGLDSEMQEKVQSLLQKQSAYYMSVLATQVYPPPSATVSRAPDSYLDTSVQPDTQAREETDSAADSDLIPPSGNVSRNKGADIYSSSDSDAAQETVDLVSKLYESGGEDYDPVPSQSQRPQPPSYESDAEDANGRSSEDIQRPVPMRIAEALHSPAKSAHNWREPHSAGRRPIRTPSPLILTGASLQPFRQLQWMHLPIHRRTGHLGV